MSKNNGSDIKQIADGIVSYLNNHPNAADTVEGIAEWWLLKQQIEVSNALVLQALNYLVSKSVVKYHVNFIGNKVYSSNMTE